MYEVGLGMHIIYHVIFDAYCLGTNFDIEDVHDLVMSCEQW